MAFAVMKFVRVPVVVHMYIYIELSSLRTPFSKAPGLTLPHTVCIRDDTKVYSIQADILILYTFFSYKQKTRKSLQFTKIFNKSMKLVELALSYSHNDNGIFISTKTVS